MKKPKINPLDVPIKHQTLQVDTLSAQSTVGVSFYRGNTIHKYPSTRFQSKQIQHVFGSDSKLKTTGQRRHYYCKQLMGGGELFVVKIHIGELMYADDGLKDNYERWLLMVSCDAVLDDYEIHLDKWRGIIPVREDTNQMEFPGFNETEPEPEPESQTFHAATVMQHGVMVVADTANQPSKGAVTRFFKKYPELHRHHFGKVWTPIVMQAVENGATIK